jgi:3-oxoacid CoA-transferase B subunit
MDLVAGVRRVVVVMEHCAKDGRPKILPACTLPMTGRGVVSRIITDLGVFDVVRDRGLVLRELMDRGVSVETIRAKTAAPFAVDLQSR